MSYLLYAHFFVQKNVEVNMLLRAYPNIYYRTFFYSVAMFFRKKQKAASVKRQPAAIMRRGYHCTSTHHVGHPAISLRINKFNRQVSLLVKVSSKPTYFRVVCSAAEGRIILFDCSPINCIKRFSASDRDVFCTSSTCLCASCSCCAFSSL